MLSDYPSVMDRAHFGPFASLTISALFGELRVARFESCLQALLRPFHWGAVERSMRLGEPK